MMEKLEALLDVLVSQAELASGATPEMVAAAGGKIGPCMGLEMHVARRRRWTEEEDRVLEEHLGIWTEEQIGRALGRSACAVKIRWKRELHLQAPSKHPAILTARNVARVLGVDEHKASSWVDKGILPGTAMAGGRLIRRIQKVDFLRWALNPKNWIWFDIRKVPDMRMRRLMEKRAERWGDEWWTSRQVADYYGVDVQDVKRQIKMGKLCGVQAKMRGGRSKDPAWANWLILRSEATKAGFVIRKTGTSGRDPIISEEGEAFMLLAYAVGCSLNAIGRLQKVDAQTVANRMKRLMELGQAEMVSEKYGLEIQFQDGMIWADWREHEGQFPRIARAMREFDAYLAGEHAYPVRNNTGCKSAGMGEVMGVIRAGLRFRAESEEQREAARKMAFGQANASPERVAELVRGLDWRRELF